MGDQLALDCRRRLRPILPRYLRKGRQDLPCIFDSPPCPSRRPSCTLLWRVQGYYMFSAGCHRPDNLHHYLGHWCGLEPKQSMSTGTDTRCVDNSGKARTIYVVDTRLLLRRHDCKHAQYVCACICSRNKLGSQVIRLSFGSWT
jgi:hypothetical protein